MKSNIGTSGRLVRLLIAIALLIAAYLERSWIALFASLFVLFEAYASWCVVYQFLGKNSCPRE
jgi:DUF2892 family protein